MQYEACVLPYLQPEKSRTYTLDFALPNGVGIETKGRFVTSDRQKHLWIQAQYPVLDLRFVFGNANARISKQSKTTYAMWCESHGFLYAHRHIPASWFSEPVNAASLRILQQHFRGAPRLRK